MRPSCSTNANSKFTTHSWASITRTLLGLSSTWRYCPVIKAIMLMPARAWSKLYTHLRYRTRRCAPGHQKRALPAWGYISSTGGNSSAIAGCLSVSVEHIRFIHVLPLLYLTKMGMRLVCLRSSLALSMAARKVYRQSISTTAARARKSLITDTVKACRFYQRQMRKKSGCSGQESRRQGRVYEADEGKAARRTKKDVVHIRTWKLCHELEPAG